MIRHALGLDDAPEPYRNHYCLYEYSDGYKEALGLCDMGYMKSAPFEKGSAMTVFFVTPAGKELMK